MTAIPLTPEIGELNETLRYLREATDRPYLDIPLVRQGAGWVPIIGTTGKRSSWLPLSQGSVDLMIRTRRAELCENLGNRAKLRIHLYRQQ